MDAGFGLPGLRTATVSVPSLADSNALKTLGFESGSEGRWKTVGERKLLFTRLRSRLDLEKTERLQRAVFGVSDRDLASSSILVAVYETGGEVLGAFDGERLVGFVSGWGGYVDSRTRLVSDLMAVEAGYRGGIGFALKALQAVVASQAGFEEIVWTVDPLRAANARLNFERLGPTRANTSGMCTGSISEKASTGACQAIACSSPGRSAALV